MRFNISFVYPTITTFIVDQTKNLVRILLRLIYTE